MATKYERIALKELRQGRKGKHHELIEGILKELPALPDGEAIKIPLEGVSASNLRAAVSRATADRNIRVATYSDEIYLYVWQKTKKSAQYERKASRTNR